MGEGKMEFARMAAKVENKLCFVISPIGDAQSTDRKHADMFLHAVVKQVLEAEEFGYLVRRADEVAEPGMINDSVIQDILSAPLAVADLTFLNPNVFYELGIRHAAQKPVIHFALKGTDLPFDNVGYRAIMEDILDWHGQERARVQLREAVLAIESPAYTVSNPLTHARGTYKLKESADPKDKIMAELDNRLSRLEKYIRPARYVHKFTTDRNQFKNNLTSEGAERLDAAIAHIEKAFEIRSSREDEN